VRELSLSTKKPAKRALENKLKEIQHEILVMVASGEPLPEVMNHLCVRAEEIVPNAICSVLRVDSSKRLRSLAAPSLPAHYSAALDGLAIGPMVGSCGTAAYYGEAVEVTDIKTDPRWAEYRDFALPLGVRACWSSPIKSHDKRVVGTFAFYFRRVRRATEVERQIVERCAHLCAIAIEHWATQGRMRRLAYRDALTGLANRALLVEEFPKILERAEVAKKEVTLYCVDINGFRVINATRGHQVSDDLLRGVAARIRETCSGADLVARLGADEFMIVSPTETSDAQRAAFASAVEKALLKPFRLAADAVVKISTAIGISRFPVDGGDLDTLLAKADAAVAQIKSTKKVGHAFYTAKIDAETRARRAFERDISVAAVAGQLSLVFQPQADASTCTVRGFEALLRWNHPIHGYVCPTKFIPAAEACGAIGDIGAFVLLRALEEAAKWPDDLRIAVNVSPAQIVNADFAHLVENALMGSGVSPSRLEIEVTESLFIYDPETALQTLKKLKALGVSVAMDDFGTGYSSLSTLRSFPFDRIKIDRSFIEDMVSNKDAAAIVDTIMGLGRALGRRIVAEGVETEEQLVKLRQQGCNEVQGYLIGKPLPIEAYASVTGVAS
jgi:diguanylate cyclase (GGDEF)-like protein